ncbi:hypothetical protein JMJ77_0008895, partial [Colletotrichum scovillei]
MIDRIRVGIQSRRPTICIGRCVVRTSSPQTENPNTRKGIGFVRGKLWRSTTTCGMAWKWQKTATSTFGTKRNTARKHTPKEREPLKGWRSERRMVSATPQGGSRSLSK